MWSFLKNRLEGGVVLLRGSFFYSFFLDVFIGMNIPKIIILDTPCHTAAKVFPTDVIQSLVQRSSDVGVLRSRVCFCFCNKVTFLLPGLKLPLRIFSSLLSWVEWKAYSRSKGVGSTQPRLRDATFVVQVLWKTRQACSSHNSTWLKSDIKTTSETVTQG